MQANWACACAAGKAPRESRSGLYILGEEWYNRLLESVYRVSSLLTLVMYY